MEINSKKFENGNVKNELSEAERVLGSMSLTHIRVEPAIH